MGSTTIWMVAIVGLLAGLVVVSIEETMRRRAAGLRLQHDLRRGAYHPVGSVRRPSHVRVVRTAQHRRAA